MRVFGRASWVGGHGRHSKESENGWGRLDTVKVLGDRRKGAGMPRVAIGSDHAGFGLKGVLCGAMRGRGWEVADLGTHSSVTVDYPAFCIAVGQAVVSGSADWGI